MAKGKQDKTIRLVRGVECHIRRIPSARRLTLTIHYDGTIAVTVPRRTPRRQVMAFLWDNIRFIEDQLALLEYYRQPFYDSPPRLLYQGKWYRVRLVAGQRNTLRLLSTHFVLTYVPTTDLRFLLQQQWIEWGKRQAKKHLPALIRSLAAEVGVTVERISIRNQKSRWGSCTAARQSISLNWRSILFPPAVLEYLIYHELAHLRYPHHGPQYWELVRSWVEDYHECEQWINRYGPAIMALTTISKRRYPMQIELFKQKADFSE